MTTPLTVLIQTSDNGIIAVANDDQRIGPHNVTETAPAGMEYQIAPRPPEQIDRNPNGRVWVLRHLPRQASQDAPDDAIWFNRGNGQQVLGNRHKAPHGAGWSIRGLAPAGEQFAEKRQSAGKYILVTEPIKRRSS